MNELEQIQKTCNFVNENSKHITINEEKIQELIRTQKFNVTPHWLNTNPFNLLNLDIKDIINFLVLSDGINFSFWGNPKWTIKTERGELDGSFALIYALLELRKNKTNLNFENITLDEFRQSLKGNIEIPLLKERYKIALSISKNINDNMGGDFYTHTKNITNDLELLTLIINNFPSFEDTRIYKGQTIYFYKLAQLLTSDILHIRKFKENIKVDVSHLVGCADYKIPQVLRGLGILEYNDELSKLVDNKEEITVNSEHEVEIRANMIVVLERIKKALNNQMDLININDFIWSLGQDKRRKLNPYHLTRTSNY